MLCRMIAASQMQFLNTWNWTNVTDEVIFHLLLINVDSHMWFVTNVLNSKVLDKVSCLALCIQSCKVLYFDISSTREDILSSLWVAREGDHSNEVRRKACFTKLLLYFWFTLPFSLQFSRVQKESLCVLFFLNVFNLNLSTLAGSELQFLSFQTKESAGSST